MSLAIREFHASLKANKRPPADAKEKWRTFQGDFALSPPNYAEREWESFGSFLSSNGAVLIFEFFGKNGTELSKNKNKKIRNN